MPRAMLIFATLAVCVALPISASAKEHRSASVKREFQLTHPCPATGRTRRVPRFSPVLAFLMAIAVEIFIGVLKDAGILEFLAVGAIGAISWLLLRKLRVRPRGSAPVET